MSEPNRDQPEINILTLRGLRSRDRRKIQKANFEVSRYLEMSDPNRELLSAVSANKLEAVRVILRKPGVNVSALACLHKAIFFGHIAMSRLLVEAGADVNARGMVTKDTPVVLALMHSRPDIAVLLLERGADPNVPSGSGQLPIAYATTPEMIETLLKHGADPNMSANKSQSPLFKAVYWPTRLKALLQAKADANVVDKDGYTPLILAAEKGMDAAVQLLLQFGADPTICAPSGRTVYEIATKPSVLQILQAHRSGHFTELPTTGTDLKKDEKVASAPMSPVTEVGKDEAGGNDQATKRRSLFGSLFSSNAPTGQSKTSEATNTPRDESLPKGESAAVMYSTRTPRSSAPAAPHNVSSIHSQSHINSATPLHIHTVSAAAIAVPDTSMYLSTDSQRIDLLEARLQDLERIVESQSALIENQGAIISQLLKVVDVDGVVYSRLNAARK